MICRPSSANSQLARARDIPTPDWETPGAPTRIIEPLIREYEAILRDYPETNRGPEIRKALAELRKRGKE